MDVETDRGTFGKVLRRLRLEARLSQEDLAERARLSAESISALERGRRRAPYRETIRMLSEALRLSEGQRSELEAAAHRPRLFSVDIKRDDAAAAPFSASGALQGRDESGHNLPLQRTSLIGRESDIEDIVRIVRASRLVTLTGAGGIGKTRTALAVGDALLESTKAGVWFVELAPVVHGSLVTAAVARALRVQESPSRSLLETLLAHLKAKSLLLIFDNCEHVVDDVAALADTLLLACPRLRILATSRESLRVAGEQTYRLPSLRVPTFHQARGLSADGALGYAAVLLFTERARRSDRGFVLDDVNAPQVVEICRQLDGIPLAIELAAARVNVLSLRELSAKLDQRLGLLTSGDRTALPRHQTMRALIDWSYDLLSHPEQRLFERLSIFAGGCTLAAMSAVYADDTVDEIGAVELLSSLVGKSLVVADLDVPEPRYRLLESFRQYAYEKLASRGQVTLVAHRHALVYAELAERLEREHDVARNAEWFARAELEIPNWRAALYWTLVERGDCVLGQRLAGAMRAVWPASAIAEGRRWLRAALESVDERTPPLVAANLEHSVSTAAYIFGDYRASLATNRRLVAVYRDLGDELGVARAQFLMGRSLANLGQVEEGEPLLQHALDAARKLGNIPLAGLALAGMARIRSGAGDLSGARLYLAEASAMYDATGADAYSALVESAAAGVEFRAGNLERAVELSTASLNVMQSLDLTLFMTTEQNLLAAYLIACERWREAYARARDALVLGQETQQVVEIAWALQHIAAAATLSGGDSARAASRAEIAARLFGYVDARINVLGTSRQYVEQQEYELVRIVLRDAIGSARFQTFTLSGSAITEEQAIEWARALSIGAFGSFVDRFAE